ncbi:MAG TPA: tripartite tricarboxylate transporter substrate binding protein [Candidatus Limnocylindria bacterium]|nr:tripartite tricarboxylate transporter substrate binding protein [Candidatus Limnocylindria bacterium]
MRSFLSLAIVTVLTLAVSPALAQYPERPVTLICPFPAGGAMDIVSRGLSEAMKKTFPQPLAVVNRAGGAGTIGNSEVVQARPDGYTLGISAVAVLTVQPHRTALPYKGPDTYAPINKLVNLAIVLAVKQDAPWKTGAEFLAAARQAPGKIRVSSPGIGTILHLILEDLKGQAAVDLTHVPFRGNGEAIPALLGGHVEASIVHPGEIVPHVEAGKARVLMVFEPTRDPLFPDVPTAKELGHDITLGVYYVLIAPKGTPAAVIDKVSTAARKALEDPGFVTMAKARGFQIDYKGSEDLTKELWDSYRRFEPLVKKLGLK